MHLMVGVRSVQTDFVPAREGELHIDRIVLVIVDDDGIVLVSMGF